jgi:hypothetical protein
MKKFPRWVPVCSWNWLTFQEGAGASFLLQPLIIDGRERGGDIAVWPITFLCECVSFSVTKRIKRKLNMRMGKQIKN